MKRNQTPIRRVKSKRAKVGPKGTTRSRVGIYSPAEISVMNATSRYGGVVGNRAIVPRVVEKLVKQGDVILDFGAGKNAVQAQQLMNKGYDVLAYEMGKNFDPLLHFKDALNYRYNIVYASNVVNVQHSDDQIYNLLSLLHELIVRDGKVVINYPQSPRYAVKQDGDIVSTKDVEDIAKGIFYRVTSVKGYSSPVFILEK